VEEVVVLDGNVGYVVEKWAEKSGVGETE